MSSEKTENPEEKLIRQNYRFDMIFPWVWTGLINLIILLLNLRMLLRVFSYFIIAILLIITAGLFHATKLLIKKTSKRSAHPALVIFMAVLSLAVIITLVLGTIAYLSDFSTEKWAKYPEERARMIKNLEEEFHLIGRSEDEIVGLLGEPDFKSSSMNTQCYVYSLGPPSLNRPRYYYVDFVDKVVVDTYIYYSYL